jgi:DNA-binding NarL/FixJ family response regulator
VFEDSPLLQQTSLTFAGRHPVYFGFHDPKLRYHLLELLGSVRGVSRTESTEKSIDSIEASGITPHPIVFLEGIDVPDRCREIRSRFPTAPLLILRSPLPLPPREPWIPWIRAGASGFLESWNELGVVQRAIEDALAGGLVLPAWAARELWERLPPGDPPGTAKSVRLTDRQQQILRLVAQGLPSKEVADRLNLKEILVRKSLSKIYRRLGVGSRTAATAWWLGQRGGE